MISSSCTSVANDFVKAKSALQYIVIHAANRSCNAQLCWRPNCLALLPLLVVANTFFQVLAKDLVRTRNYVTKFIEFRSHLQGVALKLEVVRSHEAMATAMKVSAVCLHHLHGVRSWQSVTASVLNMIAVRFQSAESKGRELLHWHLTTLQCNCNRCHVILISHVIILLTYTLLLLVALCTGRHQGHGVTE
jgi:hypothetical protein